VRADALEAVVDDAQDLLVVGGTGLCRGQLVEVDHLVQAHQQSAVTRHAHEAGQQLELVVEVRVVHDGAHAERGAGFGLGGELTAQPAHRVDLELFVAGVVAAPVRLDDGAEVVTADQLGQLGHALPDHVLR
jgi:hypothetical protein